MTTGTMTITTPGVTSLTENHYGSIVIGVPGVYLNLNGRAVIGSDQPGTIGIRSDYANTIVTNGQVSHFGVGIYVNGDHSQVSHVQVIYSQTIGIALNGDHSKIHHSMVGNVWSPDNYTGVVTAGMMLWGQNSSLVANNVYGVRSNDDVNGNYEAVGMGLNGWGNVIDCRVQGEGFEGREFGFWHSGDGVKVENSWFHGLDHAVGAAGYVRIKNSTMHSDDGWYGVTGIVDCGGNMFTFGTHPEEFF